LNFFQNQVEFCKEFHERQYLKILFLK
jgi:hypothetical protein